MSIDCTLVPIKKTGRVTTEERVRTIMKDIHKVVSRYKEVCKVIEGTTKPATYLRAVDQRKVLKKSLRSIQQVLNRVEY